MSICAEKKTGATVNVSWFCLPTSTLSVFFRMYLQRLQVFLMYLQTFLTFGTCNVCKVRNTILSTPGWLYCQCRCIMREYTNSLDANATGLTKLNKLYKGLSLLSNTGAGSRPELYTSSAVGFSLGFCCSLIYFLCSNLANHFPSYKWIILRIWWTPGGHHIARLKGLQWSWECLVVELQWHLSSKDMRFKWP